MSQVFTESVLSLLLLQIHTSVGVYKKEIDNVRYIREQGRENDWKLARQGNNARLQAICS